MFESRSIVATIDYFSQHFMRRAPKEALEFCRNMDINIGTKLRKEGKKYVATLDNYVATKNIANGRKTLSRNLKLCREKRRGNSMKTL